MAKVDRLQHLVEQNTVCGMDFIYVYPDQHLIDVYFHQHDASPQANEILSDLTVDDLLIESQLNLVPSFSDPNQLVKEVVQVVGIVWTSVDDRTVLRVAVAENGGYSPYTFKIQHASIDHYFRQLVFSFKANCPSDLDCKQQAVKCNEPKEMDFPVDYTARDFNSFRRALLEFASQKYPDWQDRLHADVGVMLTEVFAALGDELSFYQNNIVREGYLETASQRRSVRHLARLVDYELHEGLAANGWLCVMAQENAIGSLKAGIKFYAQKDSGERLVYELGKGLADQIHGREFLIDHRLNELSPYVWDEDDLCLPEGATSIDVEGDITSVFSFDEPSDDPTGKWVVLTESSSVKRTCPLNWLVRITRLEIIEDRLLEQLITRIYWSSEQAVPFEMSLESLTIKCNLLPISAGETHELLYLVGEFDDEQAIPDSEKMRINCAIQRRVNRQVKYYQTLPDPNQSDLTWLGSDPRSSAPEVYLEEVEFDGVSWIPKSIQWTWQRSLLGVYSSLPNERHFTLDDGSWGRVVGYWRNGVEFVHKDYQKDEGSSITFGDGEFGAIPSSGTVFRVYYRLGNGVETNVNANSIVHLMEPEPLIESIYNPVALTNGFAKESIGEAKQVIPHAFRSTTYRAVKPEDYAEATERLSWVQSAGAKMRWTGAWLTLFATPDPKSSTSLSIKQENQMRAQLNRFRQAGQAVEVRSPKYANIDLIITVCVKPSAYIGVVKEEILTYLIGSGAEESFFSPNNFTFGTPLLRSNLEAAIQSLPGVRAILGIKVRRRGFFDWREMTEMVFPVAMGEVIRIENNYDFPERGILTLAMEGGV